MSAIEVDLQSDLWNGSRSVPEFDRLHYYYGQMLGPRDFQTEQDYFRNKMKLQNRFLHGYGVACGLKVQVVPRHIETGETEEGSEFHHDRLYIGISSGVALDPAGNQLVVRDHPYLARIDIWEFLEAQEDAATLSGYKESGRALYIGLCYTEVKTAPQRVADPCTDSCSNYETYARLRDGVCLTVSFEEPPADQRCGPCGACKTNLSVLLARIDKPFSHEPEVHNEVRRPLGLYEPTVITGVNWQHGATYDYRAADKSLRKHGLTIRFSRPVITGTIKPGVIEVWTSDDWSSPNTSGEFRCLPVSIPSFAGDETTEVTCRMIEDLGSDDRVLIIVRTDFILDTCCQPVDGNHVGGLVPCIEREIGGFLDRDHAPALGNYCRTSVPPFHRHQSGNGVPGGTFESWFFTKRPDDDSEETPR